MAKHTLFVLAATAATAASNLAGHGRAENSMFSPLVFWSNDPTAFGSSGGQVILPQLSSQAEATAWVSDRMAASADSPTLEMLVVLESSGRGIQSGLDAYPAIQKQIEASAASAVAPFVAAAPSNWDTIPGERLEASSLEEAEDIFTSHIATATNGICDLLVIKMGDANSDKELGIFQKLQASVDKATGGKCIYALAMDASAKAALPPAYKAAMTAANPRRLTTDDTSSPKKYVHMTPDLLSGILTGLLLVTIALIGLSCLGSIQTPSKFTDKPPPSAREY